MSVEENKAKVLRAFELVNWGIVDALKQLMIPTFVGRDPTGTFDRDEYVKLLAARLKAVPDAQLSIEGIVAEGDTVAVQYTCAGTSQREAPDSPAACGDMRQTRLDVFRVANGKIQEGWAGADVLNLGRDFGLRDTNRFLVR
jgi:predicted ester cyclase